MTSDSDDSVKNESIKRLSDSQWLKRLFFRPVALLFV